MPWRPLPRIAFAVCSHPFQPSSDADLPLQLGDELYIIEQGGRDGEWFRGYLVAAPSLLSGLNNRKGQPLEARVFSGIFPTVCVEIKEILGDDVKLEYNQEGTKSVSELQAVAGNDPSSPASATLSGAGVSDMGGRRRKPLAPVPMLKIGDESSISDEEPLVAEVASCLREWHSNNLHELLLNRSYDLLDQMSTLVTRLDSARRQLMHKILTKHETEAVRQAIVWDLVQGNKLLSGEVIVRSSSEKGRLLTYHDSAIELSRLQAAMSLLDEPPLPQVEPRALHHLLVELRKFSVESASIATFTLSLHMRSAQGDVKLISEPFVIDATGQQGCLAARTLFTDLNAFDTDEVSHANTRLYLSLVVVSNEPARGPQARVRQQHISTDGTYFPNDIMNGTANGGTGKRRSLMWSHTGTLLAGPKSPDSAPRISQGDLPPSKDRKYFKRATAVGVLDVTNFIREGRPVESDVHIWEPVPEFEQSVEQDTQWDRIVGSLLPSNSKQYRTSTTLKGVTLRLTPFINQDSEALIKATPTLLQNVQTSQRLGFPGTPVKPRSDIYVTLCEPFVPMNAVLSHPKQGNAPLPAEFAMEDLQLTLEVRNAAGDRIDNCISSASNSSSHVAWRTTAVSRGGGWNQTIKLTIRPEDVPGSHLVMSLADGGTFPFALAWMPLWTHGAFVRDGEQSLALHKYDEITSSIIDGKGAYLALPWTWKVTDETVLGPGAAIRLRTSLCSTSYSQDPNLLVLLRWRDQRARDVASILKRFQFVPEIEIVKLLHEVFDALFEILVEYGGNDEIGDLVYDCLVAVLSITYDRRFDLQPLIDDYTITKFKFPFAGPSLIRSFVRLLSDPTNSESSRRLHPATKVSRYIFSFIVRARQHQIEKEAEIGIQARTPTFAKDLQQIFTALNNLMNNSAPMLVGSKTLLVQNFHTWLFQLRDALTSNEILDMASQFVGSCATVQGRLVMYRLVLINQITSSAMLDSEEAREFWRSKLVEWLDPYWGTPTEPSQQWRDQVRLCCTIVATCLSVHNTIPVVWLHKLTESYFAIQAFSQPHTDTYSILYPKSYPFPAKRTTSHEPYDEALVEISAILSTISPNPDIFSNMGNVEVSNTISDILRISNSILACGAFPASWLSLHSFYYKSTLNTLEAIQWTLSTNFLPAPEDAEVFPTDLWLTFFTTLLKVVGADGVRVETFPEQKRRAVWKIAGDVRSQGARLLRQSWEAMGWDASPQGGTTLIRRIGGYQVQYVPTLVGPIVELCLSVHEGVRGAAIAILQTMIMSEWTLSEDLSILQAEIINRLDQLFKNRSVNDTTLQKFFVSELLALFKPGHGRRHKRLFAAVEGLCDIIEHLLDLLVAVHSTASVGEASHIIDTLRLTSFLRDMHREDIFISYVHKLADIQAAAGNSAEAGLALKMHADLYEWDTGRHVPGNQEPAFPEQTAFERKERLFFEMIKHFEDAFAWDLALGAYHELENQYEFTVFDFSKLARCQRAMATIYESISKEQTRVPRYFLVTFQGLGFPTSLRDRQFIFEGLHTDRSNTFIDRMQQHYPNAQLLSRRRPDGIEGQYITITPVSPFKDHMHPVNRQLRVAQHVRDHFNYSQPRTFTANLPRSKGKATGDKIDGEKVFLQTAEPFPTLLKRSEVISSEIIRLPTAHIALERTSRKTSELQTLEALAANGGEKAFRALTEALIILVNVDSGGSVAGYWGLVQDTLRETSDPISMRLAEALQVALVDHVAAIKGALSLFERPVRRATGQELTQVFENTFAPVLDYIKPPTTRSYSVATSAPPSRMSFARTSQLNGITPEPVPRIPRHHLQTPEPARLDPTLDTQGGTSEAQEDHQPSDALDIPEPESSPMPLQDNHTRMVEREPESDIPSSPPPRARILQDRPAPSSPTISPVPKIPRMSAIPPPTSPPPTAALPPPPAPPPTAALPAVPMASPLSSLPPPSPLPPLSEETNGTRLPHEPIDTAASPPAADILPAPINYLDLKSVDEVTNSRNKVIHSGPWVPALSPTASPRVSANVEISSEEK